MKLFLVLIAIVLSVGLGVGACGSTPPRSSSTQQPPTEPPAGPEISQNPGPADIETQLRTMAFLPPGENQTGMWYRPDPAGGTKAELGSDGQVIALLFPRKEGDVRCTVEGPFPPRLQQFEGALSRTTLLGHPGCK